MVVPDQSESTGNQINPFALLDMPSKYLALLLIGLFAACSSRNSPPDVPGHNYRVIAYVNGWEDNWGENHEKAKQITHINYAFANILNGEVVEGRKSDEEVLLKLNGLKQVNPDLRILISIGGWSWSTHFSDAALTEDSREKFANSAIAFMLRHKIDGIDLDWEYPGLPGAGNIHRPEDKENFTSLLKLIREKLDQLKGEKKYLLTIATAASQAYLDHTDMKVAHQYLDFVNIMTYDFHGAWDSQTGHHANLYASASDKSEDPRSAAKAVQQHVQEGIPANKINLGVPFYGRWWKGVNPCNSGVHQLTTGGGGSYNYDVIADSLIGTGRFDVLWDDAAQVPYLWSEEDSVFITYEDKKSIKLKVNYVEKENLGGIMFWQFNGDNGDLLQTIDQAFNL